MVTVTVIVIVIVIVMVNSSCNTCSNGGSSRSSTMEPGFYDTRSNDILDFMITFLSPDKNTVKCMEKDLDLTIFGAITIQIYSPKR